MSASPIASPHVTQPATAPDRNQAPAPAANSNRAAGTTEDSRPPQRSHTAPGTGLTVDKHA